MNTTNPHLLNIIRIFSGTLLLAGLLMFLYGFNASDYTTLTSIGIGTIVGAVFIFLIGLFFVATEEMLEKIQSKKI
ncbi:MAG: hypothetical protein K0S39_2970 [Paenibacillus sp.]|jgi:uncharacterized membrane protein YiaA|nr:hypothetical protein [Paenibacillus sp.]